MESKKVVATADSAILDRCGPWLNLARLGGRYTDPEKLQLHPSTRLVEQLLAKEPSERPADGAARATGNSATPATRRPCTPSPGSPEPPSGCGWSSS